MLVAWHRLQAGGGLALGGQRRLLLAGGCISLFSPAYQEKGRKHAADCLVTISCRRLPSGRQADSRRDGLARCGQSAANTAALTARS
jgi:hypothetical protein